MKLRTYIAREDDGTVLPGVAYHPATQGDDYLARSLEHDAMAAHALLQAIEAWGKHPGYQGGESWVKHRAAQILAGWMGEDRG